MEINITVRVELSDKLETQIERLITALVEGTFRWEGEDDDDQDESDTSD